MNRDISAESGREPTRAEVDGMKGAVVIEFGASWCGYCLGARALVDAALTRHPGLRHIKVEDGPGRPLGRSFRVKLWPTLVVLADGQEVARVVRPQSAAQVEEALGLLPGS